MTEARKSTTRSVPRDDILSPALRDDGVGDISGSTSVVVPEIVLHDVEVNMSMARKPSGARCIRVSGLTNMTVSEGKALIADLTETVRAVGEIRTMLGFDD